MMLPESLVREVADQAQAEVEVVGDEYDYGWLDGVQQALCWAAGDPPAPLLDELLKRLQEVREGRERVEQATFDAVQTGVVQ